MPKSKPPRRKKLPPHAFDPRCHCYRCSMKGLKLAGPKIAHGLKSDAEMKAICDAGGPDKYVFWPDASKNPNDYPDVVARLKKGARLVYARNS